MVTAVFAPHHASSRQSVHVSVPCSNSVTELSACTTASAHPSGPRQGPPKLYNSGHMHGAPRPVATQPPAPAPKTNQHHNQIQTHKPTISIPQQGKRKASYMWLQRLVQSIIIIESPPIARNSFSPIHATNSKQNPQHVPAYPSLAPETCLFPLCLIGKYTRKIRFPLFGREPALLPGELSGWPGPRNRPACGGPPHPGHHQYAAKRSKFNA